MGGGGGGVDGGNKTISLFHIVGSRIYTSPWQIKHYTKQQQTNETKQKSLQVKEKQKQKKSQIHPTLTWRTSHSEHLYTQTVWWPCNTSTKDGVSTNGLYKTSDILELTVPHVAVFKSHKDYHGTVLKILILRRALVHHFLEAHSFYTLTHGKCDLSMKLCWWD